MFYPIVLLSILPLALTACSSVKETSIVVSPTLENPSDTNRPRNEIVIKIGNLTDKTGPGASAITIIDTALEDMVRYYNEESLIPGVKFEITEYDGQFDPARDVTGYEKLKHNGADLIFTSIPSAANTLKSRVNDDRMVLVSIVPSRNSIQPPGYVIAPGSTLCEYHSYGLLHWLVENDPNFPKDRPAKIGGAGWPHDYMNATLRGAEEYARSRPDKYDWKGSYVTDFKFKWDAEIEALKNCDYVIPPTMMNQFVTSFREAGYDAVFVGAAIHTGFLDRIIEGDIWDEIDGMQIVMPNWWWNEESEAIALAKELLSRYRPKEAEKIMRSNNGYLSSNAITVMFELIRKAVEENDYHGFSSQDMYRAAESFSLSFDGRITDTFTPDKRVSRDTFAMYEFRADEQDLIRLRPDEWLPVLTQVDLEAL